MKPTEYLMYDVVFVIEGKKIEKCRKITKFIEYPQIFQQELHPWVFT